MFTCVNGGRLALLASRTRSRAVASAPVVRKGSALRSARCAAPSAIPREQRPFAREPWHRSALTVASAAAGSQL